MHTLWTQGIGQKKVVFVLWKSAMILAENTCENPREKIWKWRGVSGLGTNSSSSK